MSWPLGQGWLEQRLLVSLLLRVRLFDSLFRIWCPLRRSPGCFETWRVAAREETFSSSDCELAIISVVCSYCNSDRLKPENDLAVHRPEPEVRSTPESCIALRTFAVRVQRTASRVLGNQRTNCLSRRRHNFSGSFLRNARGMNIAITWWSGQWCRSLNPKIIGLLVFEILLYRRSKHSTIGIIDQTQMAIKKLLRGKYLTCQKSHTCCYASKKSARFADWACMAQILPKILKNWGISVFAAMNARLQRPGGRNSWWSQHLLHCGQQGTNKTCSCCDSKGFIP